MTEEKTEEEIIRNCGYIDCVRIDHPKRKWFPSDKAILKENLIKDYVLIEDVEYLIEYGKQHHSHPSQVLLKIEDLIKLKSRGRE